MLLSFGQCNLPIQSNTAIHEPARAGIIVAIKNTTIIVIIKINFINIIMIVLLEGYNCIPSQPKHTAMLAMVQATYIIYCGEAGGHLQIAKGPIHSFGKQHTSFIPSSSLTRAT